MTESNSLLQSEPLHLSLGDRQSELLSSIEKRLFTYFGQSSKPSALPEKGDLVLAKARKGISISVAHHQQLVLLARLPSLSGVKLGDLLDNILTAYFEDYAPEILYELQNLRTTFPGIDAASFTRQD